MAGLQRSSETFRRSGSSGMVWEWDDKHLSGEIKPSAAADGTAAPEAERRRSAEHAGFRAAGPAVQPALDPPSPRGCCCCPFFSGKSNKKKKNRSKGRRRH